MSTYIYSSRETFLARCWWQSIGDDTTPVVEGNAVAKSVWRPSGWRRVPAITETTGTATCNRRRTAS